MLKIRKILGGLIKSSNEKELDSLKFYVNKINELEPHYKKFSLDQAEQAFIEFDQRKISTAIFEI